jgi:hypothetical protein
MLINFTDDMSYEEKLQILLAYHKVPDTFIYDNEDIPMIVMALNQDDVESIKIDDEGAIDIAYYGDDWQNPAIYKEE